MADRVSKSITIGGRIARAKLLDLMALIAVEGLSKDWDGEPFDLSQLNEGEALTLMAHEVAWGRFDEIERFCVDLALPFVRASGSCAGQWGAERVVYTGQGEPTSYPCCEDDYVVIGREHVERLGTIDAVVGYFEAAEFAVPPLGTE